jgi:hypothetical protein
MSIFEKYKIKGISESSINLYIKNILRLNDNQVPKNLNFLKNVDLILKKIEEKKPNTRRTYIISIVSLLRDDPKNAKLYDKYYKLLSEYNKNLKENIMKTQQIDKKRAKNTVFCSNLRRMIIIYGDQLCPKPTGLPYRP